MSQLSAFIEALQQDPETLKSLKTAKDPETLASRLIETAQAKGYEINAEEVHQTLNAYARERELTDQELDSATGGAWDDFPWTFVDC